MSMDLKSIADRIAIRDVLDRYCRGIDRLDADLVNSVYWDDAIDDHGTYKGAGKDFAAFVIPILRDNFTGTMHCLNQSLIELDGARAKVETYFSAHHWRGDYGSDGVELVGGRYVDVLEEREGEWRIRDRVVIIEWARADNNIEPSSFPLDVFAPGRRDKADLAYGRK
jgi:hypothetical protein